MHGTSLINFPPPYCSLLRILNDLVYIENTGQGNFNQRLECAAPKCWSKFTIYNQQFLILFLDISFLTSAGMTKNTALGSTFPTCLTSSMVSRFFWLNLCPAIRLFNLFESHTWMINYETITLHNHELMSWLQRLQKLWWCKICIQGSQVGCVQAQRGD